MPLITRFEDVYAWQEARVLTRQIYSLTQTGPFSRDYGLRDQIQRAAVSVMANIAEGFDCESRLEFVRFMVIARRSVVEVQSLLYTALDCRYIDEKSFNQYYAQAKKTKGLINAFKNFRNKNSQSTKGR